MPPKEEEEFDSDAMDSEEERELSSLVAKLERLNELGVVKMMPK